MLRIWWKYLFTFVLSFNYAHAALITATTTSNEDVKLDLKQILRLNKTKEMKSYLNESSDPCDNFYDFVCGNFGMTENDVGSATMPNINSLMGKFNDLLRNELEVEKGEGEAEKSDNLVDRKLKQFYRSCINMMTQKDACVASRREFIKNFGKMPALLGDNWMENEFDWSTAIAEIAYKTGESIILRLGTMTDFLDNSQNRVAIMEQEFDVPAVHLYNNKEYADYKIDYCLTVSLYLQSMLGLEEDRANEVAEKIVDFEIELSQGKIDKHLGLQNSEIYINLIPLEELSARYGGDLNVTHLLQTALDYVPTELYVNQKYLETVLKVIRSTPKAVVANYIYYKYYSTLELPYFEELEVMRIMCVSTLQQRFYKQLDNMFYRKYITEDMKPSVEFMWHELKTAFRQQLLSPKLQWMAESTRKYALEKLEAMRFTILSFEANNFTQEFAQLHLSDTNYLENLLALQNLKSNLTRAAIYAPPQPDDDGYAASYVPSYSPIENLLKIPVSFVYQYHLYASAYPNALNFGTLGVYIGHEMLHGFDDAGRKYDAKGNSHNWWQPHCTAEFQKRTSCFVQQYHRYTLPDGKHLPVMQLQAENISDNGGIRAAFTAYRQWYEGAKKQDPQVESNELLAGLNYTNDQLFFISYGQSWCSTYEPTYYSTIDAVHVPSKFRVLGPLSNLQEFATAFNCPLGTNMNPVDKCEIY
ncbi:endothelin-converting enzyme homolog [Musca domestica]|uniref:Endothelin-converting enzyme homolog n=1 Tax=Musca domestica TaxID=7370 RepID=A0A9J7CZM2_MUSDO|nr:endothelin-converting enzyme homolog [Musca domestica]